MAVLMTDRTYVPRRPYVKVYRGLPHFDVLFGSGLPSETGRRIAEGLFKRPRGVLQVRHRSVHLVKKTVEVATLMALRGGPGWVDGR